MILKSNFELPPVNCQYEGMEGGEIQNYIKVWISALASITYCYFISFNIPAGKFRFFSLLPVFYFLTTLPPNLTTIYLGGTTAFFLVWLANFKLILFSFGKGPLSTNPSISLSQFISIACFPIKIKIKQPPSPQNTKSASSNQEKHQNIKIKQYPSPHNIEIIETEIPSSKDLKSPLVLAIKILSFAILSGIYPHIRHTHPKIMSVFYCFYLYLGLELCLVMVASLVKTLLGIEIEPQFDEPYMSTSLQDFWGRRWNLTVSNILRPTVYNPTKLICLKMLGTEWATLPAILSTFVTSGIMHEIIYYYIAHATPTWEVTLFFVLHGVLLVLEILVKRAFKDRCRFHPVVSGTITLGILMVTADWLFFPQMLRCNADVRSSKEIFAVVDFLKCLGPFTMSAGHAIHNVLMLFKLT